MRLEDAVRTALARLRREGIDGWGLYTRSAELEDLGEWVQVGPTRGCLDERCPCYSHAPAAPKLRWVPRSGVLHYLGFDGHYDFYVLRLPGRDLFIRYRAPESYHAYISVIDPSQVPEYLLARLAETSEEKPR